MRAHRLAAIAIIATATALIALPAATGAAGSADPGAPELLDLRLVTRASELAPAVPVPPSADPALASAGRLDPDAPFVETGEVVAPPLVRPPVVPPGPKPGSEWKPGRYTLSGIATFYDNGTTAMRLPRGTVIRVCGAGGCLERTVNDYGPFGKGRIIDLQRADFFAVCGCPSWSGTTTVTVHVY
jgi:hypothetical protein